MNMRHCCRASSLQLRKLHHYECARDASKVFIEFVVRTCQFNSLLQLRARGQRCVTDVGIAGQVAPQVLVVDRWIFCRRQRWT